MISYSYLTTIKVIIGTKRNKKSVPTPNGIKTQNGNGINDEDPIP